MNILIIIPTYNEADNIFLLVSEINRICSIQLVDVNFSILVVDDGSPDGTASIVKDLQKTYANNLFILERTEKRGLKDAYITGFKWGIEHGFDVFLEMDADFSHKPEYIPVFCKELMNDKYDVVVGSRNIKGGSVEGWGWLRNFISKGGSLYSRIVLGMGKGLPYDLTGGFNMWTREALDKIGLDSLVSSGYSFQIEMKYRAYKAGCKIKEVPIIFPDRKRGKSKMSKKIFLEALFVVWRIR